MIHNFKANVRFEKSFQRQKTQMHFQLGNPKGKKMDKRSELDNLQKRKSKRPIDL